MDGTTNESRARSFSSAAARYAAHRPSYPPALFDTLAELTGFPLVGARVADVGASTGIATALLEARGARVVGVEPGAGMAAEFRRRNPRTPRLRADGNRLPPASGCLDLLRSCPRTRSSSPANAPSSWAGSRTDGWRSTTSSS
ncbi:class I SAM-dependent methyltransferase [Streptomyces sp. NPDC059979]|uniref:class I SAM-dependent methyltransferase n=1 Tax=Streptomyces sp. NPDC059979 TaxID=3347021 RepID=UPI00369E98D5